MMKLIETADGSHTIYLPEMDETYHSRHGALRESMHVFIKNGLREIISRGVDQPVRIFELGLGTGLNAVLSRAEAVKFRKAVHYTAIEPFPVEPDLLKALNYESLLPHPEAAGYFHEIHEADWEAEKQFDPYFVLQKQKILFEDFISTDPLYHLIYYDAFAPAKQPDIWSLVNIQKAYDMLLPEGILVTYCAQGQFKRDLKAAGFVVSTLPGPPGKKEMVRAEKPAHSS